MARRKTSKKKSTAGTNGKSSFRPIWAGSIDFGLVNIPVKLYSAQASSQLEFDLLDKRDFSRVRYRRVNEKTGQEVPWDQIVKGYEYEKGAYVALGDKDFRDANVEATQSIEIMNFVDAADISPLHYETPYYLEPLKNGRHAYALLREVLKRTGKVGIAKVVIRNRQRLAALIPQGPLLVLNILRYAHELRDASKLALPQTNGKGEVSNREIKMAEELVENMVGRWNPEKYHDEYYEDLLKLIQKKVKAGKTKVVEPAGETPRPKREGKVIDIMDLLRQSVKQTHSKEGTTRQRKAG
ncbi:MAG TPA: Ku protein [Verrucomicrobiae bacterium]|nr:Ku protein [Verrucomicrobiae bacterium]